MKIVIVTNLFPNPAEPLRAVFMASLVRALRKEVEITAVIVPLPWFPLHSVINLLRDWMAALRGARHPHVPPRTFRCLRAVRLALQPLATISDAMYKWRWLQRFKRFLPYAAVPDYWEWEGISVFCPKYFLIPKIMGALHPATVFFSISPILARLKREDRCHLVNAHFIYPDGVAAFWAAQRLSLPAVLSARGTDINRYIHYAFRRPQIMGALLGASRITAVSQALVEVMAQKGIPRQNIFHIPNGINLDDFYPHDPHVCQEKLGLDPDRKHLLFVGRLSEEKNLPLLIEAIRILQEENHARFDVHLVGEGPLRPQLEAGVRLLKYPDWIYFHGPKTLPELSLWYGAAWALCLPSLREGTPNVILEALASGRPVLASRVGGCVELIQENQNGYLLSPYNPTEWANGIKTALSITWKSDQIAASVQNRTWADTARAYHAVYRSAMEKAMNTTDAD